MSPTEQDKAKADPLNPPGTYRKIGPSLRRIAEKTNEEWARRWINSPRGFRPDTKMPHFYNLSNDSAEGPDALPDDQKDFPSAEIHSIAHYLFTESATTSKARTPTGSSWKGASRSCRTNFNTRRWRKRSARS